jgi:hypothetical protein
MILILVPRPASAANSRFVAASFVAAPAGCEEKEVDEIC